MELLYENRKLQLGLTLLYPLLIGVFFVFFQLAFWMLAIGTVLIYCAFWKNIGYALLSHLLVIALSILLWVIDGDYMGMGSAEETRDWLPFAYLLYGACCIVPSLLLVPLRNLLKRLERRSR